MTEFDRWSKEEYYTYDALCRTDAMKLAWKAALEWALTQETDLQFTELGSAIHDELKETENEGL